jgi:hypothetical protein
MKQLLAVFLLLVFVLVDVLFVRPINAIRNVDGAVIDTANIVPMVTTDRHLINRTTINSLISRIATTTLNFRPGRVGEHLESDDIRDFFVSDELYNAFVSSFSGWGLAEYDINDIVFKEAVVLSQRATRTFEADNGQLLWFVNVRMSVRDRGVGGESTSIITLKLTLMHRNATEGVGIYDYELKS